MADLVYSSQEAEVGEGHIRREEVPLGPERRRHGHRQTRRGNPQVLRRRR